MKVDARRVEAFLSNPGNCRVVLLYGEDAGLVRERGTALVLSVAGSLDHPFRVAELERDGVGRIVEEIAAVPMTGGRRVVRVRDVTDAAAGPVRAALASKGEGLVVLEAGELTGRSKLRSLVEAAADGASIACYSEQGADLARTIAGVLAAAGLRADPEAAAYLATHLGNDRGVTRQELNKLALYIHPNTLVDLEAAMSMIGDLAGLQIDDALYAATVGDVATADRALSLAFGEGASAVSVLRTMLMHLQKLDRIQVGIQSGQSAAEAVRSLRPPVFYRRQDTMIQAAALWPAEALAAACTAVWEAERACKRTGAPINELCRHTVSTIARRAAGRRRG